METRIVYFDVQLVHLWKCVQFNINVWLKACDGCEIMNVNSDFNAKEQINKSVKLILLA